MLSGFDYRFSDTLLDAYFALVEKLVSRLDNVIAI